MSKLEHLFILFRLQCLLALSCKEEINDNFDFDFCNFVFIEGEKIYFKMSGISYLYRYVYP